MKEDISCNKKDDFNTEQHPLATRSAEEIDLRCSPSKTKH